MNVPEFLRAVEAKLFDVIRDTLTPFLHAHESRLMASIDTINQTLDGIQADIAQIKTNQQNQTPSVATQEQVDAVQARVDGFKSDLDTLSQVPQPAPAQ